jgi:hypothetical protein
MIGNLQEFGRWSSQGCSVKKMKIFQQVLPLVAEMLSSLSLIHHLLSSSLHIRQFLLCALPFQLILLISLSTIAGEVSKPLCVRH